MSNIEKALKGGFEYVYEYPDGINKIAKKDCVSFGALEFYIEDKVPAKIKHSGEIWHNGWDCPTRWAIDENLQCWMNDAHGHALEPVNKKILLQEEQDEIRRNRLRRFLNMKPEMPEWIKTALAEKWIPPKGFDPSIYKE